MTRTRAKDVVIFSEDNGHYEKWLKKNPDGFVINTTRIPSSMYMVLHRAKCKTPEQRSLARVAGMAGDGYTKVCSTNIEALRDWLRDHGRADGTFSTVCQVCQPLATKTRAKAATASKVRPTTAKGA
jgi:hypothetical protein